MLQEQIEALGKKRRELPPRIKVGELPADSRLRLETERKILTDTVEIMAYRVESAMLGLIRPHYSHAEQEGRPYRRSFRPQATSMSNAMQSR